MNPNPDQKAKREAYNNYRGSLENGNAYERRGDFNSALAHTLDALKWLRRTRDREDDPAAKSQLDRELSEVKERLSRLCRIVNENEHFFQPPVEKARNPTLTSSLPSNSCKISGNDINIKFKTGKLGGSLEGDIFRCDYKNAHCAIKIYKKIQGMTYSQVKHTIKKDMENTLSLNHPNVLRYYGYYVSPNSYGSMPETIGLVMDIAKMDLSKACMEGLMTEKDKKNAIMDVLAGLVYLHSVGVVHSDLKPENVLLIPGVESDYRAQLCDFGLSAVKESRQRTNETLLNAVGYTMNYAAPEVLTQSKVCAQSDTFSLASMAYYLLEGKRPFQGCNELIIRQRIENADMPRPSSKYDEFWKEIFESCWKKDPKSRPSDRELYAKLQDILKKM